jgi:AraC-like DNA-binding protein
MNNTTTSVSTSEGRRMAQEIYKLSVADYSKARNLLTQLRERKLLPEWEINKTEGILYFNHADFFMAARSFKRAYYDEQVQKNDQAQMSILLLIITCYDKMQDVGMISFYVDKLKKIATEANDEHYKALSSFYEAKILRYRMEKKKAYVVAKKALEEIKKAGDIQETYYYWVTYIVMLQDDHVNQTALAELNALQQYLKDVNKTKELQVTNWADAIEAHKAVLLARLGKKEEAHRHYERFMQNPDKCKYSIKHISVYLSENNLTQELIDLTLQREQYLRQIGNVDSYDIKAVYSTLCQAYMKQGNLEKANHYLLLSTQLQNKIRESEEKCATQELSINYELHLLKENQQKRLHRIKIACVVIVAMILLIAAIMGILRERHYNAIIVKKNRWMAKRIEQLLKAEKQNLQILNEPTADMSGSEEENSKSESQNDADRIIFKRILQIIDDEKLFLKPDLNRDMILKNAKVSKNRFTALFRKYTDNTFSHYVTEKRLEYAIGLMKSSPHFTNHAIATDSGFANDVSFYKAFADRYGMTPAEYRHAIDANDKD